MSRLIDADMLNDAIEEYSVEVCVYDVAPNEAVTDFHKIVDEQPTACDIYKVVEQLERLKETVYESYGLGNGAYVAVCNAIEIVKKRR